MIDVGAKKDTKRIAKAQAYIKLNAEIVGLIRANKIPKGNVLEAARFAGILAAKNTAGLLPLCHNLPLNFVGVEFTVEKTGVLINTEARSTAALTIYDMCKMFAQNLEISDVYLLEKLGGKSGHYISKK